MIWLDETSSVANAHFAEKYQKNIREWSSIIGRGNGYKKEGGM